MVRERDGRCPCILLYRLTIFHSQSGLLIGILAQTRGIGCVTYRRTHKRHRELTLYLINRVVVLCFLLAVL